MFNKKFKEGSKQHTRFELVTWAIFIGILLFIFLSSLFFENNYFANTSIFLVEYFLLFIFLLFIAIKRDSLIIKDSKDETEGNEVDTKPLKKGGANFKNKNIIFKNGIAYTETSLLGKILQWIFLFIGGGSILVGIYLYFFKDIQEALISTIIAGTIFSAIGLMMILLKKKITFDKSTNIYYIGKSYDYMLFKPDYKKQGKLGDIKNIQILKERVRTDKNVFYSYEINLVLKDGNRINVIDHGNLKSIKKQAQDLSQFLGVSIEDGGIFGQLN